MSSGLEPPIRETERRSSLPRRLRSPGPLQKDLLRLAGMCGGYVLTALLPARFDGWVVDRLAALFLRVQAGRVRRLALQMRQLLGSAGTDEEFLETAREHYELRIENDWGTIRGLHRRGWPPDVQLVGLERLRGALDDGRGAILWHMFFGPNVVPKAACWRNSIPLTHLSRAQHGVRSPNWFTLHSLAPLLRRCEDRYLAERIVIPRDGSLGYMKALLGRLAENATLSIYAEHTGRQNVATDFFEERAEFATGAPSLAWKMGSALLPVYVVREGRFRYRVVIDEPIEVDRGLTRKEFAQRAIEDFSRRLQLRIAEYPADWMGWVHR